MEVKIRDFKVEFQNTRMKTKGGSIREKPLAFDSSHVAGEGETAGLKKNKGKPCVIVLCLPAIMIILGPARVEKRFFRIW